MASLLLTRSHSLTDYRKRPRALSKVYFDPIDAHNSGEMTKLFESLAGSEPVEEHRPLSVWGRKINVPLSTPHIAQFKFIELCGKPLSAADYLEITKTFKTIFLVDVPQLGLDTKDQARRFILFIDAAYEAKVRRSGRSLRPRPCPRRADSSTRPAHYRPSSSSCPTLPSPRSFPTRNPRTMAKSRPINAP